MANEVHPTAILQGDIRMGAGNVIMPYSVLTGPLDIGDNNVIGPHTVIGGPGQDTRNPRYDSSQSRIRIGSDNIIREHVAIQKPCHRDMTSIGDRVYLMHNVHIPHDARLEDDVVVAPGAVLAGLVSVLKGANIAIGCVIHQHSIIGQYSITAMGAAITKNVKPFSRSIPGKPPSVNAYAVKKYGFRDRELEITRYVVDNIFPESSELISIIKKYSELHEASGRKQY